MSRALEIVKAVVHAVPTVVRLVRDLRSRDVEKRPVPKSRAVEARERIREEMARK